MNKTPVSQMRRNAMEWHFARVQGRQCGGICLVIQKEVADVPLNLFRHPGNAPLIRLQHHKAWRVRLV